MTDSVIGKLEQVGFNVVHRSPSLFGFASVKYVPKDD